MKKYKNKFAIILFIYLFTFLVFTFLFILLLYTPLFSNQRVLFYRGLALLLTLFIISLILAGIYINKYKIYSETIIAALIISISINFCFFVVFPVTFDRSITMYLLNTLNKNSDAGLTKNQLNQLLINEYVIKNQALEKRLYEQKEIKYLTVDNQNVRLTNQAKRFLFFSELIKKLYNIK